MAWTCSCGAVNEQRFCGQCGQQYGQTPRPQWPPIRYRLPKVSETKWPIFAVVGIVVVGVSLVVFSSTPQEHSPATVHHNEQAPSAPKSTEAKRPTLSAEEIQNLTKERKIAEAKISADSRFMSASSFGDRAAIYCSVYVATGADLAGEPTAESQMLTNAGIIGLDSITQDEDRYAQLMRAEPKTMDEETDRQAKLRSIRGRLNEFYGGLRHCESTVASSPSLLPSADKVQADIATARQTITEINQKFASVSDAGSVAIQ